MKKLNHFLALSIGVKSSLHECMNECYIKRGPQHRLPKFYNTHDRDPKTGPLSTAGIIVGFKVSA